MIARGWRQQLGSHTTRSYVVTGFGRLIYDRTTWPACAREVRGRAGRWSFTVRREDRP